MRIDFGDAVPTNIAGVTAAHLAYDFLVECNRIIHRNVFLTGGFSVSFPGPGVERAVGGGTPEWIGGFINVVVNY
ncbi:MAG: hypothetical protein AAGD06_15360 [Acidobacteriota bacterium]